MATTTADITDTGGTNFASVANAALVGNEYGLTVRNIESPANSAATIFQVSLSGRGTTEFPISDNVPAPDRRSVRIKNGSTFTVFLGLTGVTISDGYALLPGEVEVFDLGPAKQIVGIMSTSASGTLYVMELG